MKHNRALDGVRGLAILLVIAYHISGTPPMRPWAAALAPLQGGWAGVDLFFVLSGYLITGILLETSDRTDYYRRFYYRRVLRIVPAYATFLAFTTVMALAGYSQRAGSTAHASGAAFLSAEGWYWAYLVNFLVVSYGWTVPLMTGHTWSLSVEEQFYVVWPWLVRRCRSPRAVAWVAAGTLIVCPMLRGAWWLLHGGPMALYVLTPFRADGFAMGALLAVLAASSTGRAALKRWGWVAAAAGLGGFLALGPHYFVNSLSDAVFLYTSTTLLGGCLVAWAALGSPWIFRVAPMRVLGKYSYGIYLWHVFATVMAARLHRPAAVLVGDCVFTAALVACSWYFVEAPALRLKDRLPRAGRTQAAPRPVLEAALGDQ